MGGTQPDNIPDLIFSGEAGGDNFGYSVASAGDVNNDGFSDILIGAYLNDAGSPDAGRAYIFLGGAEMDNIPDIILTGALTAGHFGTSVSSAGDVNNDGFSDVIIGYPISEVFFAGESYIYFGGASMDNTADVMLAGESGFDSFGFCVSTAGDVNNDGFSDVIVGATSGGFNIAGSAYLYFGGTDMDSIPDVIFEGEANQDFYGTSVSTAADINNDGFSDVITGANWNDGGGIDAGRAYLYFGGAEMNNAADIIFTGEKSYDHFGCSVASAGDVNKDGFSDFVVGALSNDDKAPDVGQQVSSGIYFYRLSAKGESGKEYSKVMKMMMIK